MEDDNRIDFHFTRPQTRILRDLKACQEINLEWGRGAGKSFFLRFIGWHLISQYGHLTRKDLLEVFEITLTPAQKRRAPLDRTGIRITWLMPTFKQFKGVHGNQYLDECAGPWRWLRPLLNKSNYSIAFPNGSSITPYPASAHHIQKARGLRTDVALDDERDDIDINVWDAVRGPWFSEPWSLQIGAGGGTPKRGRHGLLYRQRKIGQDLTQSRYRTSFATYKDVPEIVSQNIVDGERKRLHPSVFRREWEQDYDAAEGLVLPFDEQFHVKEVPHDFGFHEYIIGVDHGWNDPGVFLLIGIHGKGKDAIAWVLAEVYMTERPPHWWVQQARSWDATSGGELDRKWIERALPRNPIMACDPSRPDMINEYLGVGCNAMGADNDIAGGIGRMVDMMFKRPRENGPDYARFYVRPTCVNTIREFGLYRRRRDPTDPEGFRFTEDIVEKDDHCPDACRYPLLMRFGPFEPGKIIVEGR